MLVKPFLVTLALALTLVPALPAAASSLDCPVSDGLACADSGAVGIDGSSLAGSQEAPCEAFLPEAVCDRLQAAGEIVREEIQRLVRCIRYGVC